MASMRLTGIALVPGTSANKRAYSPAAIASMVTRASVRIAEGSRPITVRTMHDTNENILHVAGKLTSIKVGPDGSAVYVAELARTTAGMETAELVRRGIVSAVSIRGRWVGPANTSRDSDGVMVESADDLELDGVDLVENPGVAKATARIMESAQQFGGFVETAPAPAPDTLPDGVRDIPLHLMTQNEFQRVARASWAALLADQDARMGRGMPSPFWTQ